MVPTSYFPVTGGRGRPPAAAAPMTDQTQKTVAVNILVRRIIVASTGSGEGEGEEKDCSGARITFIYLHEIFDRVSLRVEQDISYTDLFLRLSPVPRCYSLVSLNCPPARNHWLSAKADKRNISPPANSILAGLSYSLRAYLRCRDTSVCITKPNYRVSAATEFTVSDDTDSG